METTTFYEQTKTGEELALDRYLYSNKTFLKTWYGLGEVKQLELAEVYRRGFAGPPWFEVGNCSKCGRFTDNMAACNNPECGNQEPGSIGEAYPLSELVNYELPSAMSKFVPGTLVTASVDGSIKGFATGGEVRLRDLIDSKYNAEGVKGTKAIIASVIQAANTELGINVDKWTQLLYENEAVVDPEAQFTGIGAKLNYYRLQAFREISPEALICGRTVNETWLDVKVRQFTELGYAVARFVPEGDKYVTPEGKQREFFLAKPNN